MTFLSLHLIHSNCRCPYQNQPTDLYLNQILSTDLHSVQILVTLFFQIPRTDLHSVRMLAILIFQILMIDLRSLQILVTLFFQILMIDLHSLQILMILISQILMAHLNSAPSLCFWYIYLGNHHPLKNLIFPDYPYPR